MENREKVGKAPNWRSYRKENFFHNISENLGDGWFLRSAGNDKSVMELMLPFLESSFVEYEAFTDIHKSNLFFILFQNGATG